MSVSRLQVTYKSPEVDEELDKKILEFFNTLDFICIDREYHFIAYKRELFFERQTEEKSLRLFEKEALQGTTKVFSYREERVDDSKRD